ncbi:GTPase [Cetobacterium sp.]|uniref:GTPase n=1 Tax=Cetobacterium sp. TaxID=2071632 RepID=UPI003F3C853E
MEKYNLDEDGFIDVSKYENEFEGEIKKAKKDLPKVKIMLIGGTGVGKSSLINTVFGDNIATVGHGIPTSRGIERYEIPGRGIIVYDSEGYEIGDGKIEHFNSNILSTVQNEGICAVWYCISAPNSRVTEFDKEIIKKIKKSNVSIYVVLTQGDKSNPSKIMELKKVIKDETGVDSFLVTTNYLENKKPKSIEKWGYIELENLMDTTIQNISDEDLRLSLVKEQKFSLKVKEKEADKIINQHVMGNVGIAFTPIPLSDAPLLFASQLSMVARVVCIYDLSEKETSITNLVKTIGLQGMMQQSGKMASKYVIGQAVKFIPGMGVIGGGIINASVAAVFTKTLGYTVSALCFKMKEDIINNTDKLGFIDAPTTEMFLNVFKQQIENRV